MVLKRGGARREKKKPEFGAGRDTAISDTKSIYTQVLTQQGSKRGKERQTSIMSSWIYFTAHGQTQKNVCAAR